MNTKMNLYAEGVYAQINPSELPKNMEVEIMLDIGENSNKNMIDKLNAVGGQILPSLNEHGAGMVIKTEAPAVLATKLLESMGLDSNDFLEDYTTDEFKQRAAKAVEEQTKEQQKRKELEDRKLAAEASLSEANVAFTGAQTENTYGDNARQMATSIDKSFQEWAELTIKAVKEGAALPPRPDYNQIIQLADEYVRKNKQQGGQ